MFTYVYSEACIHRLGVRDFLTQSTKPSQSTSGTAQPGSSSSWRLRLEWGDRIFPWVWHAFIVLTCSPSSSLMFTNTSYKFSAKVIHNKLNLNRHLIHSSATKEGVNIISMYQSLVSWNLEFWLFGIHLESTKETKSYQLTTKLQVNITRSVSRRRDLPNKYKSSFM